MKYKINRRPLIIASVITVCLLGAVCFIILYFNTSDDPDLPGTETEQSAAAQVSEADSSAANYENGTVPEPVPSLPPAAAPQAVLPDISMYYPNLTGDEYITVRMDELDIHRGYLLLVNKDHKYDIPDDLDLESIVGARTSTFRVRSSNEKLQSGIMVPLNEMMDGFIAETGRSYMYIISAYRDHYAQQVELNSYINLYGRQTALMHASEPGYSEHHTGLAMDMATYVDGVQYPFDHYSNTSWFFRNAHRYGFILRYQRGKTNITGTVYEPWHYRYVGLPHSSIMYNYGWVLEEYIDKLRDYSQDNPYTAEYDDIEYEIFFTESTTITVPTNAQYEISGNNVDGFIVTISGRYDRLTNVAIE